MLASNDYLKFFTFMDLKQLLYDYLKQHDIEAEITPFGVEFENDDLTFQLFHEESDDQFFQLILPRIYEVDENNYSLVTEAADQTNARIKVVKTYVFDNQWVNVAFEILADYSPELSDIVPRALSLMREARITFYKNIENLQ